MEGRREHAPPVGQTPDIPLRGEPVIGCHGIRSIALIHNARSLDGGLARGIRFRTHTGSLHSVGGAPRGARPHASVTHSYT